VRKRLFLRTRRRPRSERRVKASKFSSRSFSRRSRRDGACVALPHMIITITTETTKYLHRWAVEDGQTLDSLQFEDIDDAPRFDEGDGFRG
jgi:hypothetical protein